MKNNNFAIDYALKDSFFLLIERFKNKIMGLC